VLEVLKQNVGLGKKNTPTISGSSASAGPSSAATSSSTTNPSKKRKLKFGTVAAVGGNGRSHQSIDGFVAMNVTKPSIYNVPDTTIRKKTIMM